MTSRYIHGKNLTGKKLEMKATTYEEFAV